MRRAVIVAWLVIAAPGSLHADPWRYGVAALSRVDPEGDGGLGLAVAAIQERPRYDLGAVLEHTWLFPQRQELGIRQVDAVGVIRWGRPLAFEAGAGLAIYHGRVDLPGGCTGCGMYGGTTVAPLARIGIVWARSLRGELALEIGARLVVARPFGTRTDVHNFDPPPVSIQTGVGVTSRF